MWPMESEATTLPSSTVEMGLCLYNAIRSINVGRKGIKSLYGSIETCQDDH